MLSNREEENEEMDALVVVDEEEEEFGLSSSPGGKGGVVNRRVTGKQKDAVVIQTTVWSSLYAALPAKQNLSSQRNLILLGMLGSMVLLFVLTADETVLKLTSSMDQDSSSYNNQKNPHQPSFGGVNNVGQPGGAKAAAAGQGVAFQDISDSKSSSSATAAVASLNVANIVNLWGHYMHDEHRSPYASHLYNHSKELLDAEQAKFVQKMQQVRTQWGAWSFQDDEYTDTDTTLERPVPDFSKVPYKDLPNDQFPKGSWQTDEPYVRRFIEEAKSLVDRVTEGIYAEYASPRVKPDGTPLTEDELDQRAKQWGPKIIPTDPDDISNKNDPGGIATMSQVAMDGLVRKLLHSLLTNDEFYVVLGGHSAAAGHGNQFQQNKYVVFHHLMEPVMDKLGIRLVSRNMAQGGVGTLQFSLGGKDMYGEADLMEWDSAMTEGGPPVDLWNKQAILSGERVPVILNPQLFSILEETNGTAMMGFVGGNEMIPATIDDEQAMTLPYAVRWFNGAQEKYNAICWEPRSDVTPMTQQADHPGSQVSWHPGFRYHHFHGRKIALLVLKGLKEALQVWEEGIDTSNNDDGSVPLPPEHYWHVGTLYETIRDNYKTNVKNAAAAVATTETPVSACETGFHFLPRVCRVAMHGYGMWEPRAHEDYDLLKTIQAAPNGYKPAFTEQPYYSGFDVLPYSQAVPDGEVDVHAIAIATTFPAPDLDHEWVDDDDDEEAESDTNSTANRNRGLLTNHVPTRSWLKEASERAFLHKPNVRAVGEASMVGEVAKPSPPQRRLGEDAIVPGRGWYAHGWSNTKEFCDGSPQSTCQRSSTNNCLMAGHNDNHKDVSGSTLSGWIVFHLPNVKEGIILARMEWWCGLGDHMSKEWTEVNDGKTLDETPYNGTNPFRERNLVDFMQEDEHRRNLKPTPDQLVPQDLKMDVAINGKIIKTWDREEWIQYIGELSKNCAVWPLLDDENWTQTDEPIELAIRFRVDSNPHQGYCISHIYYA